MIPDDELIDTLCLQRVDKVWRQYKYDLKQRYFKPDVKSIQEICESVPNGVSRQNWLDLVKYWNSDKGQVCFHYMDLEFDLVNTSMA